MTRTSGLIVVCLGLAAGCVSSGRYQRKEAELSRIQNDAAERDRRAETERRALKAELDSLNGQLARLGRKMAEVSYERDVLHDSRDADLALIVQLRKRLEAVGQNVETLIREKGALAASMADAYNRLQEVNRQKQAADQRAATYQGLVQKLQAMISAGQLDVVIRQGRMLIVMPNDVMFDSGRIVIKPQGRTALAAVARALGTVRDRRFTVVGHTDDVPIHAGRFRQNWDLSTARAVEVTLFLVDNGLSAQSLAAAGRGEFEPLVPNDSAEHRAKNRRVEIELEPNITELPSLPATAVASGP